MSEIEEMRAAHARLHRIYEDLLALGAAAGAVSKAKALLGRDIDDAKETK